MNKYFVFWELLPRFNLGLRQSSLLYFVTHQGNKKVGNSKKLYAVKIVLCKFPLYSSVSSPEVSSLAFTFSVFTSPSCPVIPPGEWRSGRPTFCRSCKVYQPFTRLYILAQNQELPETKKIVWTDSYEVFLCSLKRTLKRKKGFVNKIQW